MSKQIVSPRPAAAKQQAAQNAARAALALYRAGCQAQARKVWTASMEAFQ